MSEREYVIWSFEHDAWWGPGRMGYTSELAEAGRYTKAQADQIVAHANVVSINEVAISLSEAQTGGPPRYSVVPEHNQHGGDGWTLFDRERARTEGGWFADRIAAEQTAAVMNRSETE